MPDELETATAAKAALALYEEWYQAVQASHADTTEQFTRRVRLLGAARAAAKVALDLLNHDATTKTD